MNWAIGQETISGGFEQVLRMGTGRIPAVLVEQTSVPGMEPLWSLCKARVGNPCLGWVLAM